MSLHTNGDVIHRDAIYINNDLHKSFVELYAFVFCNSDIEFYNLYDFHDSKEEL